MGDVVRSRSVVQDTPLGRHRDDVAPGSAPYSALEHDYGLYEQAHRKQRCARGDYFGIVVATCGVGGTLGIRYIEEFCFDRI